MNSRKKKNKKKKTTTTTKKKKKNTHTKITTIYKPVEQIHYCVFFFAFVFFFQIITWKEREVYVLSKNLHQSVPYAQNDLVNRRRMDRNKIRSGDKIQNGSDCKFCRLAS